MNWFINLFTAAKPLSRKLRKLGGRQLVPPASFFVVGRQGPLHKGEIERAKTWTGILLDSFRRTAKSSRRADVFLSTEGGVPSNQEKP